MSRTEATPNEWAELARELSDLASVIAAGGRRARLRPASGDRSGAVERINDLLDTLSAAAAGRDRTTGLPDRQSVLTAVEAATTIDSWAIAVLPQTLGVERAAGRTDVHRTVDEVLRSIASRIETAAPGLYIGNLADREFIIFGEGSALLERTLHGLGPALAPPVQVEASMFNSRMAIGHASQRRLPPDHDLVDAAVKAATIARETEARSPIEFEASMRTQAVESVEVTAWLGRAVSKGALEVWYQPILDLGERAVTGYEALVRGRLGERLLAPGDFMEAAEVLGVIGDIGNFVLAEALAETAGLGGSTIAVNLSPMELIEPQMVDRVLTHLDRAGVAPDRLVIEITESHALVANPGVAEHLAALRSAGVELAVDDFGSGYSSLDYLRRHPFSVVKLDRSIVAGLDRDPSAVAVVRSTVELAHDLGMKVVAEGVEYEAELDVLVSIGCDRAQGFLIGRPAPR